MCGEQWFKLRCIRLNKGSPPRVRGTVKVLIADLTNGRITPACAGNSSGVNTFGNCA